jgi:hypothetical protein
MKLKKFRILYNNYKLQITNYKLQITNYKLQITNYKLQITNYKLQITNYKLQIAYKLYSKKKLKYTQGLNCWVVSPGGIATISLINYLNKFIKTNSEIDEDLLKHRIRPPKHTKNIKVIFLKGSSEYVLNSLKNRYLGGYSFYFYQFL